MKLIILDRDGVINQDSPDYIKSPEEWIPIPGSLSAIAQLNQLGFTVVVATNQSGVGRGYFSLETLAQIHAKMQQELAKVDGKIDHIYFCPHRPEVNCDCRKPKTGMFKQIARDYQTDLKGVINIGDALRDLQAGTKMGCKNILVLTGKGKQTLQDNPKLDVKVFSDLYAAVQQL